MIALVALAFGLWGLPQTSPSPAGPTQRVDELYLQGPNPTTDREALALAEEAFGEDPRNYDFVWRLSRACTQLAGTAPKEEKRVLLDRAIKIGEQAVALSPQRPEGHYWLGASCGQSAALSGMFKAFGLAGRLRSEMEAVLRLEPDYEGGDAFRALAELDTQLPSLFGGSRSRAIARSEEGVRRNPGNLELRLTLAKAYLADGKREPARRVLETLVDFPVDPSRPNASRETRAEAARILASMPPPNH